MFDYISGKITEITPSYIIIDNNGIGYFINISLQTYSKLNGEKNATVFIHQIIREDSNTLYGFADKNEREMFRLLISVSGIGGNTARLMLSSLNADEIRLAILSNDVNLIKSVKGIGLKTAQRIIVDLKDKVGKASEELPLASDGKADISEAVGALVMLGFNKKTAEKTIRKIYKTNPSASLETLIKEALKLLAG